MTATPPQTDAVPSCDEHLQAIARDGYTILETWSIPRGWTRSPMRSHPLAEPRRSPRDQ